MKKWIIILALFFTSLLISEVWAGPKLQWDCTSPDETTGYRIYYGTSPGSYSDKMDVGQSPDCGLSDLPLKNNTTYYFVVRSYNENGESVDSNEISWTSTDTTPPSPPQGLTVK